MYTCHYYSMHCYPTNPSDFQISSMTHTGPYRLLPLTLFRYVFIRLFLIVIPAARICWIVDTCKVFVILQYRCVFIYSSWLIAPIVLVIVNRLTFSCPHQDSNLIVGHETLIPERVLAHNLERRNAAQRGQEESEQIGLAGFRSYSFCPITFQRSYPCCSHVYPMKSS